MNPQSILLNFFPQYIYLNSSTYNIQFSIIHTLGLERKQESYSCFSSCFTLLYIVVIVDIKLTCRGTGVPGQQDVPLAHLGLD